MTVAVTPTYPTLSQISSINTQNESTDFDAYKVQLVGNLAYITDYAGGVQVYDISNPASPVLVTSAATAGPARNVQVSGNYVYVAELTPGTPVSASTGTNPDGKLQIFQIHGTGDSTTLSLVSTTNTVGGDAYRVQIESVTVNGVAKTYAYLADYQNGVQIYDVTTPATPTLVKTLANSAVAGSDASGITFATVGTTPYVFVNDQNGGVLVYNNSNPNSPTLTSTLLPSNGGSARSVQVLTVGSTTYAYVAEQAAGVEVFNITNPATPTLLTTLSGLSVAKSIQIIGNFAYVGSDVTTTNGVTSGGGLYVLNLTNPGTPTIQGYWASPAGADTRNVQVDSTGTYAYVADQATGVQILNVSNPSNITQVSSVNTQNKSTDYFAYKVQLVGNLAYITDYAGGVQVYDISNPTSPVLVTSAATAGPARNVQVSGN
jgi:hypothetical protein